jgi:hypothetical protein
MEMPRPAIDQLRLAAGLVHTVPDAELHLFGVGGAHRVVSAGPGGDLTPCQWRTRVIRAREQGGHPGPGIVAVELGGSLRPVGGTGVARRDADGAECWFATLLCPTAIEAALQDCRVPVAPEHVAVAVRPDPLLGVSAVRMRIVERDLEVHLPEIGMVAAAACTVEELLRDVRNGEGSDASRPADGRPDRSGGRAGADGHRIGDDGPQGPTWPRWLGGA